MAVGTAAETGHRRPLEVDQRVRTLGRSAARQAAGQADQRGRIVAHRPRLSSFQRRTWVTGTLSAEKRASSPHSASYGASDGAKVHRSGLLGAYITGNNCPIFGQCSTSMASC